MLVLLRALVSKHLTDASISAPYVAACEASWFRPGGLICDWLAAVNIHTHLELSAACVVVLDNVRARVFTVGCKKKKT